MFGDRVPDWRNEITLRSLEWWLEHDITQYMKRISPTPLLMILAARDQISPIDFQLEAFDLAREPKRSTALPSKF